MQEKAMTKTLVAMALAGCCLPAAAAAPASAEHVASAGAALRDSRAEAQDRYVAVNGLRLHYREWGSPSAPPLLILHGITGHAWEFDGIAAALGERWHVLVLDQRGHGASAWSRDYAPAAMAGDVAALVDALRLERVSVVGHSMGGVNAWWYAARHPARVERLAILDVTPDVIASPQLVAGMRSGLEAYADAAYADPQQALAAYLPEYTGPRSAELREFVRRNLQQGVDGQWRWRFDARGLTGWLDAAAADEAAHWSALRRIDVPVLIVRAGDSPFTASAGVERMVRELPRGRLVEIAGSGHDLHLDRHDALLRELRRFLSGA
jgi:pimeloyl-ACP methyl ester carboxylesterase